MPETNEVFIYVDGAEGYGTEGVVDVTNWKVEPDPIVIGKGEETEVLSTRPHKPPDEESKKDRSNAIHLIADVDRHGSDSLPAAYINAGHTADGTSFPMAVNDPGAEWHSAYMCVDGTLDLPVKMNFYFPLSITTPEGFQMNLLLGQCNVKHGWRKNARDLYPDGKKAAKKLCAAVEKNDWADALKEVYSIGDDIVKVFKDGNLWNVTVIGTKDYPAAVIELPKGKPVKKDTQLLCMGPAANGLVQTALFQVADGDYSFRLTVYPAVEPTA